MGTSTSTSSTTSTTTSTTATTHPVSTAECPPSGRDLYFDDENICEGYWLNGAEGAELKCQDIGQMLDWEKVPWFEPGCGCGCMDAPDPCNAVPDGAMGVGTPDETCAQTVLDCLPGYTPWYIPQCGCGCYANPIAAADEDTTTTVVVEECPPPGGDLLISEEQLCQEMKAGQHGGIQCAADWEPYYLTCGCGCAPTSSTAELFSGNAIISRMVPTLDEKVSMLSVLVVITTLFAMYQIYSCWTSRRNAKYDTIENYQYQSL